MNGLGWELADEVIELRAALESCRWWQWRKRRQLREKAAGLEAQAEEAGLDLGPLFGQRPRLRLGPGAPASEP